MLLYGSPNPLFHDVMHAGRGLRIESAQLLEAPPSARFKSLEAFPNTMFNGRIIADVEVQISLLLEHSPVAPIQDGLVLNIKCAGNDPRIALREDETDVRRKATRQFVEECAREVLVAIVESINVSLVELKHQAHIRLSHLVSLNGADGNALLEKLATLPLDLRAPVAAKGAQIVVKRLVAAIPPVKLETEPGSKTDALERLDLIAKTEIDVDRRKLVLLGNLHEGMPHDLNQLPPFFASGCKKAHARHRREGNADKHFGIVPDPKVVCGLGPLEVEDEFPHAVKLKVHRTSPDDLSRSLDNDVMRQPTCLLADAAALLQGIKPVPLHERRATIEQPIPIRALYLTHLTDNSNRELIGHAARILTLLLPRENLARG